MSIGGRRRRSDNQLVLCLSHNALTFVADCLFSGDKGHVVTITRPFSKIPGYSRLRHIRALS